MFKTTLTLALIVAIASGIDLDANGRDPCKKTECAGGETALYHQGLDQCKCCQDGWSLGTHPAYAYCCAPNTLC